MAKGRKQRKKNNAQKRYQPWKPVKMKFFQVSSPFPTDVPFDVRYSVLNDVAKTAETDFNLKFSELDSWFEKFDAVYLLSFCSFYFLNHPSGVDLEAIGEMEFYPHYLEILHAISLSKERSYSPEPLKEKAQILFEDMKEIGELITWRLLKMPDAIPEDEKLNEQYLRLLMIQHTMAVRNWAYENQMRKVTSDLAQLVNPHFNKKYGFDVTLVIEFLFVLRENAAKKMQSHLAKLRDTFSSKNYRDIIIRYNKNFINKNSVTNEEIESFWEQVGRNINHLRISLMSHSDLFLEDINSFTIEEAHSLLNNKASKEELHVIANELSYMFGELADVNKEYFLLDNPIHKRPFIRIEEEKFFTPTWQLIPHLSINILEESVVDDDNGLKQQYSKAKAKYLEDSVGKLVTSKFPNGKVYKGSMGVDDNGRDFENDLLVLIDKFALVIECKSGSITDSAKRGAPERFKETLKKLIIEPSDQALRFINFLKSNRTIHRFKTLRGEENVIDNQRIEYYLPIAVTLSQFGVLSGNLKKLIEAGIVTRQIDSLATSITLTDLELVLDVLENEAEIIHYFSQRRKIEKDINYEGDEMDLLAYYLECGLNFYNIKDGVRMNLILKSKELDPYFIGTSMGKQVKKPQLAMTKWWKDIINTLAKKQSEGWLEITSILLNTMKSDQIKFEKKVKQTIQSIRKGELPKMYNWLLFWAGPEQRRSLIVAYFYRQLSLEDRNEGIFSILDLPESINSIGTVIIGINVDTEHYPYNLIARKKEFNLFL